ncbi:DUF7287 family protein [Haloplanus salilacus]|uniref:DUF7287 family protein n=1 Tax=Haloplanus salilacus TaxID=2949994 RepID=UPI0030D44C2B
MTRSRGQTTLDFAVGVSLFLGVVAFAFAFAPTMFAPFGSDTGVNSVIADRSADRLAADALVDSPDDPAVLDGSCTRSFFDGSVPADCRYTTTDLGDTLGLDSTTQVNVTIRNASGIRSLGGTRLAAGDPTTTTADVVVARRVVLLPGSDDTAFDRERNQLLVRVW